MPRLYQELNRIRRSRGLSFDRGEWTNIMVGRMLPSVAAAVRGPQGPVAAICLCGETSFTTMERLAPLVADAAVRSSRALFPEAQHRHPPVTGQRGHVPRPVASSPRSA